METESHRPSALYWLISIALLLWAIGGVSMYVAYFVETPTEFSQGAEDAAHREAYANYLANIPLWVIAVGIVAAVTRLLGALGLLVRRAWALPFFVLSTGFFLLALFRAFVLADVASVMSAPHIAIEVGFVALSVFAVLFARRSRSKGVLSAGSRRRDECGPRNPSSR